MVPISPVLLIEGVPATRQELTCWTDRDFWFEWHRSEQPFVDHDRPWERARLIVNGAPTLAHDPATQFVKLSAE